MLTFTAKQVPTTQHGIHDAVKDGNVQILEVMVKNGASVNEHDTTKHHFTPLHWACHVGSLEVWYLLVVFKKYLFRYDVCCMFSISFSPKKATAKLCVPQRCYLCVSSSKRD